MKDMEGIYAREGDKYPSIWASNSLLGDTSR